jgi:hypothetical protein
VREREKERGRERERERRVEREEADILIREAEKYPAIARVQILYEGLRDTRRSY